MPISYNYPKPKSASHPTQIQGHWHVSVDSSKQMAPLKLGEGS